MFDLCLSLMSFYIYLNFGVFTAEAKSMSALALKGKKAKALYDFQGENEDELSFKVRMCIYL